jgi:phosphatidylinositol-binding clathrin assembly protein
MSKSDAERAMEIYRKFTKQTDYVVQYLGVARQWEHHTRVEVPKLKHAPTNLGRQLEDYLKDPDFEIHRRQYLAELDAKKKGGVGQSSKPGRSILEPSAAATRLFGNANGTSTSSATDSKPLPATKGPEPDLIDFFESIEQNQTPMAIQNPATQQQQVGQQPIPQVNTNPWPTNGGFQTQQNGQFSSNGFAPQQQTGMPGNSPFQAQNLGGFPQQQQQPQLQPNFTGAGFGSFTPQQNFQSSTLSSIPQDSVATFQTGAAPQPMQTGLQAGQQTTNPFRASMLMANPTGMTQNSSFSSPTSPQSQQPTANNRLSTNPFARASPQGATPFSVPTSTNNSPFLSQSPATNTAFQSQPPAPLQPMQTGTNPFARTFGPSPGQPQQRPQTSGAVLPQPTGTNPFRQGAFVDHQTGQGWQNNQQPIGGGLDQLPTVPVFPRPAQQTPWQQ